MGEEAPLRCSECLGKFGEVVYGGRCGLCGLHWRIGDLLRSDRFPSVGNCIIGPQLKEVYYKALEVADGYRVELAGGLTCKALPAVPPPHLGGSGLPPGPPGTAPKEGELTKDKNEPEDKKARGKAIDSKKGQPEESPKAKASGPDKRPAEALTEAKGEPEESEYESGEEEEAVEKSPERARSSGRGHRGDASPGREGRAERNPVGEERRPKRERESSPNARKQQRRCGETGRSPRGRGGGDRRPPSPEGLPPPREEEGRWRGPIPAFRGERPPIERRKVEPKYTNKGRKKRKQQAKRRRRNARPLPGRGWGTGRERRTRAG